ncbi:MAG: nitrogen fixation protein NifN, partial [Actinobacteria bacterium]|nr:nitrogen fixation protein NifN [Actinomycetota bacterium]
MQKLIKEAGALVSLDTNPCKMCMPMGVVNAAYGVSRCMTILHGSQGCSTYIRRHMATHYNEPIDIASSALTEQGTVYGGEANLKKGIDNLIKLYDPEVITIATTCLAETIGEDVPRILSSWREENSESEVTLIPVASPGYGGTQFEGYFRFLHALVAHTEFDETPNARLNIVSGPMSPADMRYLKDLVAGFGIDAIFLPDGSDALDGAHMQE